jgi:succinyldiaminopimelate transaminase
MRVNPALDQVGAHPIAAIQHRVRRLEDEGRKVIDFSIGDPREPTWEAIPEAVRGAVPAVSQYPTTNGTAELRRAIAGYVGRRFKVGIDPDTQVMPTSGAKEAIFSTALAFVDRDRGDVVAYPDPAYPVYERGAVMAGARAVAVPTDDSFLLTADRMEGVVGDDLALLWICSPSNPTGAVTGRQQLMELVETTRASDSLLCSDECYVDLYDEGDEPPASVLEVAGSGSAGVLSYLSLSKRSGMTGYRSGAIVGDAAAIERLYRLRTSTGTASAEFIQAGAAVAWLDDAHVGVRRRAFSAKRAILRTVFEQRGLRVWAEAGLYLWIEVGDDLAITERLAEEGVAVTPGRIFGSRGAGHIRLALVPPVEECAAAAEVVAGLL